MRSAFLAPEELKLLKKVYAFSRKHKPPLYLVGGILRDMFLERKSQNPDLDFCLKSGAIVFGRKLSKEIQAGFVVLDQEHGACRLVKKIKDKVYTLDFSDFRGPTIEEDLLHRDFTINALAVALEEICAKNCLYGKRLSKDNLDGCIIDPYGARDDLKRKIIRVTQKRVFDEDPLRVLRAFSFAAIFSFRIDRGTLKLIKSKAKRLSEVSCERIRDEVFKLLDRPDAFRYLAEMDDLGIIKNLIPEIEKMRGLKQGPYHHLDVWRHTLETIKQLELLFNELKNKREISEYLKQSISGQRRRRALLKLGALLHDIGKPAALRHEDGKTKFHGHERIGLNMTQEISRRLKLSNDESDALGKMVYWHLRPGYLADNTEITARARFRYFRDTAQEAPGVLLLSIADQRATRGPLTSKQTRLQHEEVALGLIKEYFRKKKEKKMPRLINGDELIRRFHLEPSPLIGKILAELEELQAIGRIKSRNNALAAAENLLKKIRG